MSRFRAGAASAALAAGLAGIAVGARGGTALESTGIVEMAIVAVGAAIVCLALLTAPPGRVYAGVSIAAFAALAAITALSIGWSIAPAASYIETGRTLAYLVVFAAAVAAARLVPRRADVVARGILLATVAIASYGLAARIWPGAFDESTFGGRIGQPFDYWNALAGAAASGIPAALWLGSRRTGMALSRAAAYPAVGVLIATVLIAQSRGALIAAAIACLLWLAIVPLRLRSVMVLAVGAIGAAPVVAWALSKDAFRLSLEPLAAREAVAGDFGLALLAMVTGLFAAGLVIEAVRRRWTPSLGARKYTGTAIAAGTAVVCLALTVSVAASERGLTGTVSDRVDELTSEEGAPPVGGGRFGSASSERAEYWGQALRAFDERPTVGLGAGTFELARLRYRTTGTAAAHAHGFVHQTLADVGLLGAAAALALFAAWLVAAGRTAGLRLRRGSTGPAWTAERAALVALALTAVTYGLQSAADWTWFVPGVTAIGLVAAGFVGGRGPLPASGAAPLRRAAGRPRPSAPRIAAALAAALLAVVCVWTIWQPVAADRAVARAYELLDEGRPVAALREAEQAHDLNRYAKDPLYARADAFTALGREGDALRVLRDVVVENPRDSDPWLRIATFQLDVLNDPIEAVEAVDAGFMVDPQSQALLRVRERALATAQATVP